MKLFNVFLLIASQFTYAQYVVDWAQFYTEPGFENSLIGTYTKPNKTCFVFTDTADKVHIYEQNDMDEFYEYTFFDVREIIEPNNVSKFLEGNNGYHIIGSTNIDGNYHTFIIRLNHLMEYDWTLVFPNYYNIGLQTMFLFDRDTIYAMTQGYDFFLDTDIVYNLHAIDTFGEILYSYEFSLPDTYKVGALVNASNAIQIVFDGPELVVYEFDKNLNLTRDTTFSWPYSGLDVGGYWTPLYFEDKVIFSVTKNYRMVFSYDLLTLDGFQLSVISEIPNWFYSEENTYLDTLTGLLHDFQKERFINGDEFVKRRTFTTDFEQIDEYEVQIDELIDYGTSDVWQFDTSTHSWVGYLNNLNGEWPWPDEFSALLIFQSEGNILLDSLTAGFEGQQGRQKLVLRGSYGFLYNSRNLELLPPDSSSSEIVRIVNLSTLVEELQFGSLLVYPNPFYNQFSFSVNADGWYHCALTNMKGQIVKSVLTYLMADSSFNLSAPQIPEGQYELSVIGNGKRFSSTVVKL
ncbi:MAG: hypothetical protein R2767_04270 [Chitinophagales bacterium]